MKKTFYFKLFILIIFLTNFHVGRSQEQKIVIIITNDSISNSELKINTDTVYLVNVSAMTIEQLDESCDRILNLMDELVKELGIKTQISTDEILALGKRKWREKYYNRTRSNLMFYSTLKDVLALQKCCLFLLDERTSKIFNH